jgi:hypothetical protein
MVGIVISSASIDTKSKPNPQDDPEQSKRFIDAAREAGADATEKGAGRTFKAVVKPLKISVLEDSMPRKHPQNGPSFSKAPYQKPKPLTDDELAEAQARQKEREEAAILDAAKGRRFSKTLSANGGTIPIRGGSTEAFWSGLKSAEPNQPLVKRRKSQKP